MPNGPGLIKLDGKPVTTDHVEQNAAEPSSRVCPMNWLPSCMKRCAVTCLCRIRPAPTRKKTHSLPTSSGRKQPHDVRDYLEEDI